MSEQEGHPPDETRESGAPSEPPTRPTEQMPADGGEQQSDGLGSKIAAGWESATKAVADGWDTAGEKVADGLQSAGKDVKKALRPKARIHTRRWSWDRLMRAEDGLIGAGLSQPGVRAEKPPPRKVGSLRQFGRALVNVVGFPFWLALGIVSLLLDAGRLLVDLGPALREALKGREGDDPDSEETAPRFPQWRSDRNAPDRVGLALSGGGIRSATFNLGMLQKLDELKLLRGFDYLATVSGGGYIGGFWSAWLERQGGQSATGPFPSRQGDEPEPEEIRHLREFSNFLRPRLDLFSFSTGRLLTGLIGSVVPSVVVSVTVIACALGFWAGLAWLLLSDDPLVGLPIPILGPIGPAVAAASLLFVGTLVFHFIVELMWLGRPEDRLSRARLVYWLWAISSSLIAAGAWYLLWHVTPLPYSFLFRPLGEGATADAQLLLAFFPLLAWGLALAFLIVVRVLSSRWVGDYGDRTRRAALGRALSRVIFCLALWAMAAAVWVAGQWLAAVGVGGVGAALSTALAGGGSFAWLRGLFAAQPNKPRGEGFAAKLKPLLPKVIAVVTVGAAAAATVSIIILTYQAVGYTGPAWLFGIAFGLAVATCVFFEPHENGFHAPYRERLARAYLGASNSDPVALPFATEVRPNDDVRMDQLTNRPLHLVCCAANDLAADGLRTLHRGAESAVLSKIGLQVGDVWRGWKKKTAIPNLSHAMTASAAAFNSHMGAVSMRLGRPATFLLAALGLRLGLWVEGPVGAKARWRQRWAALQRNFPGLLFFRELLGFSSSRAGWVHLSDGAHFENLAFYELVRRHCRYILVSDCGADPEVAFDDFGNAVRRVREDFGVEIDIDLAAIRPGAEGARQPVVAGDICYPGNDKGILLYVKPTLIGDEPEDIAQYARRNRDFPHETTLDQFYDEAQWEAYRRLGFHVIGKALAGLSERIAFPAAARTGDKLVRVFLEARLSWPPSRTDDVEVLAGLDRDWTKLEREVAKTPSLLRDELFPVPVGNATRSAASLAEQLPTVQEALRLMAAVFLGSGLNDSSTSISHPRYQGWLNRFGRWTATPAFRAWWPWLSPMQDRAFVEFMGRQFDLVASKKHENARVEKIDRWSPLWPELDPWLLIDKQPQPPKETYGYFDQIGPDNAIVLAGVAELQVENGTAIMRPDGFTVPPGLWSIGIGETFLDRLVEIFKERSDIGSMRVEPEPGATHTFSAEASALYGGAGFKRDAANGGAFVRKLQETPASRLSRPSTSRRQSTPRPPSGRKGRRLR